MSKKIAEVLLALEDQQVEAEADDADELGGEADARDAREPLGARQVDAERDQQQAEVSHRVVSAVCSMPNRLAAKPEPYSATAVIVTIIAQM